MKTIQLIFHILGPAMVLYVLIGKKHRNKLEKMGMILIGVMWLISITINYLL